MCFIKIKKYTSELKVPYELHIKKKYINKKLIKNLVKQRAIEVYSLLNQSFIWIVFFKQYINCFKLSSTIISHPYSWTFGKLTFG